MHGVYVCMCGWVCVHAWVLSDCTHACIYVIIQRLSTWCALLKELLYIIARGDTVYYHHETNNTARGRETFCYSQYLWWASHSGKTWNFKFEPQ